MEINKYGVDLEKLNSKLQDVPNLAPNHDLNPPAKTFGSMLKEAVNEVNTYQKVSEQTMADMATNKNHLLPQKDIDPYRPTMFYRDGHLARNDGNSVDLDIETSEMGKNDIMYQAIIGALRKQGGIFTYAIESSRNI